MTDVEQRLPRHVRIHLAPLRSRESGHLEQLTSAVIRGGEVLGVRLLDGPSEIQLRVERAPSGYAISGSATGRWEGECRRCLRPIDGSLTADIDERFDPNEGKAPPLRVVGGSKWVENPRQGARLDRSEDRPSARPGAAVGSNEDGEPVTSLLGEVLDVTGLVRESLLFALPLAPICADQCPGPDPETYPIAESSAPPLNLDSLSAMGGLDAEDWGLGAPSAGAPEDGDADSPTSGDATAGDATSGETAEGEGEASERGTDPRWAKLRSLEVESDEPDDGGSA